MLAHLFFEKGFFQLNFDLTLSETSFAKTVLTA